MVREVTQLYLQGDKRNDGHTNEGIPGDCFRSAIAGLLDLNPEDVPHFMLYANLEWWWETRRWLQGRGLDMRYIDDLERAKRAVEPWLPVVICGKSPRGTSHAVIGHVDGTLIHDPHPSRAGIVSVSDVFVLADPYPGVPDRLALIA